MPPLVLDDYALDGEAFDRFLVKAAGGQVPSDRTRQVLAATLDRTVRRRPALGMALAAG